MSPETIQLLLAFALGFAVAGMVSTGYQLATRRPASFRLLRRGPAPATFAAVPFLAFAAPFIIMRNMLRRPRIGERRIEAVLPLPLPRASGDVMQLIETLEAGNAPAVVSAINATRVDNVAACIYRALWSRLVGVVARAYAPSRPGDLHAQHAFDLLKDQDVRSEVEKIGDPAALEDAIAKWARCRDDHRRPSIETFRDKQIAHWGTLRTPRRSSMTSST